MIQKLQHRFALSRQGSVDLIKACIACVAQDISFMVPVSLLYLLVVDLLNGKIPQNHYYVYIGGTILCVIFIFIATWFQYNTAYLATYKESGVRRISLAEQLRKIPLSFFSKKDLADLTNSIMNDCATLENAFSHFIPSLIGSVISTILMSIGLFVVDWRMALAAIWVFPVAFIIVLCTGRMQRYFHAKGMKANVDLETSIQEYIESMQDLKSNNATDSYIHKLNKKIDTCEKRNRITECMIGVSVISSTFILRFGIATVVIVGSTLLIQHRLDIPTFFMFLLVASRLFSPLESALQNLASVIATKNNIKRMNEILEHPIQQGSSTLTNDGYDIQFHDVNFAYASKENILHQVSLEAKQGQITALIGPSGGGKTTISRLAARFWDIPSGQITIGGMDISTIDPEHLLSLFSIVFQDVTLFNNTIMENIRIGRKDATDEEVLAAAKYANCDTFAMKLPDGYHSIIGENGCQLSGGERQRISIARAFLKDAPIILLDEATASLDVENETLIQSALSRLVQNKTVLIIAHRMRTIQSADKIIVLANGKIHEQGSPNTLLEKKGMFAHMLNLQNQSQHWEL